MNYLIFDTETTGLSEKDEVIQFSGLLLDSDFKLQTGFNWYCETPVQISKGAFETHGIDKAKLHDLAKGYFFEDYWTSMYKSGLSGLSDLTYVGWNVSFDERLINQTLNNNGLDSHDFGNTVKHLRNSTGIYTFDLMEAVAKLLTGRNRLKLVQAASSLKIDKASIDAAYSVLAKKFGNLQDTTFHNSLYDTYVTYLLFKEYAVKLKF